MAYLNFTEQVYTLNRDVVMIAGRFTGNGASSPLAANNLGRGFSVTRTGTGAYTITLNSGLTFPNALAMLATVQQNTPSGRNVVVGAFNPTTRSFAVQVYDLATPTAQDLASTETLSFMLVMTNSSQVPVKG